MKAIADRQINATGEYINSNNSDRYTAPFNTESGEKIVISGDSSTWFASMVRNGEIGRIIQNNNDGSRTDSQFDWQGVLKSLEQSSAAGDAVVKFFNTQNNHPYKELDVTKGPNGQITAAQVQLEQNIIAAGGSIGQIFGSAIGNALAPNDPFGRIVTSTVAGLIGQKLLQTFTASLTLDASRFVASDFANVTGLDVAHAGIGAISSFLTAELGHEMGLTGLSGQLFNGITGGITGSVLNQVVDKIGTGVSFDAAIGAINWGTAVTQAGYNVASIVGSYLGRELVPAQTHEGAVGGQLLGAVGSAIGISIVLANALGAVLNFIVPGLGSLIGTIVGTLIGDAFGSHPHPAAVDLIDQAGYLYGYSHSQLSASDGGDYRIPDQMKDPTLAIINTYLHAVDGAALDHSKQAIIGYTTAPDFRYLSGTPGHPERTFTNVNDAVQAVALDVLQHTEVIGGDLLTKRAHQNSPSNIPEQVPTDNGGPRLSAVSSSEQLVTMSGDLRIAQDYENYLNNREAINALMAANPDSAFTAGWIATFARVNDLGLNHTNTSDFLGGLVAGYFDSIKKAGLNFDAANVSVKHGSGSSIVVEIRVANGVDVPGSLSVFADQTNEITDASGKTVQFVFANGLAPLGFHGAASAALVSGVWQVTGGAGNNLWFGRDDVPNEYRDNESNSNDILVGGALNDVIHAGNGSDFVDGGAGDDLIFGASGSSVLRGGDGADTIFGKAGNDQLAGGRGSDVLRGSGGNDSYIFGRGDGADTVYDDYGYNAFGGLDVDDPELPFPTFKGARLDGGSDSLVFAPGISVSDVSIRLVGNGDLIVAIKDPANPNVTFDALTDRVTLQSWSDQVHRIETFRFADGTTLDLSTGQAAIDARQRPFGESLSGSSVMERSAVGTKVGTVSGFDFNPDATLSYSLLYPDGRFAINASTGVLRVAGAIDYDPTQSPQVMVRISDGAHVFDQTFTIGVIDIPNRAPVVTVPAGAIKADPGQSMQASSLFGASDADGDTLSYIIYDNTISAGAGHFMLNGAAVPSDTGVTLTAAQFAQLSFVAGAAGSSSDLNVRAYDGHVYSGWGEVHVNVNRAPVLSVPASTIKADPGQVLQVSSLFSASDADGDTLSYVIYDNTISSGGGHLVLNGVTVPSDTTVSLSAAQLAQLTFVAGAPGSSSDLSVSAYDGHVYSGWGEVHVNVERVHADFNGDGRSDILWRGGNGAVALWNSGVPAGGHVVADPGPASNWHIAGLGDFDGNARADILWQSDDGTMAVWDNGTPGHVIAAAGTVDASWHIAGVGDFDGNTHDDILWRNDSGAVAVWNDGMPGHLIGGSPAGWHVAGVGDFDGNGKADILWQSDDGAVAVWDNGVPGHVIAASGTVDASWHIAGVGDFDGNRHDDILWHNDSGAVAVWNDGTPGHLVADQVATSWHIAGVGDFDANGMADIFWRNDDGAVAIWDNGTPAGGHVVAAAGQVAANWHIVSGYALSAVDAVNRAPVLSVPAGNITANAGQVLQVSSLFGASDADGDALTYHFEDGTPAANSGYFVLNGTLLGQGARFGVDAAQLAGLTFVAGAEGFPDDWSMQLSDGYAVSALGALHINVNHAPVLTVPANDISANAGQPLQVSSLFSASDADGDALTYHFEDETAAANSGYFVLNGTPQAQGASFGVNAAQLAGLTFVAGAVGFPDEWSMQLSDGRAVSAGEALHVSDLRAHAVVTDFNGDGRSDILWFRDDGTVSVWDNGDIAHAHWIADPGVVGSSWHIKGDGDFDGNHHDDILWQNDNAAVSVWDNGALAGAHIIAAAGAVAAGWQIAGVGDFDGNHQDDVLWRNDNGTVSIWDNGQLATAHVVAGAGAVPAGWHIDGIGDFDDNGRDDILWHNDDGRVSIWDNGQIAGAHLIVDPGVVASSWKVAGTGDFDGNGRLDILWRNDNGAVSIWDNGQIGGAHIVAAAGTVAASWHIEGVGDFDGNGRDDVLWRRDDATVSVWDNGELAHAHWIADPGQVANSWHIA